MLLDIPDYCGKALLLRSLRYFYISSKQNNNWKQKETLRNYLQISRQVLSEFKKIN